jgi:acetolactate synthase-1/2/3 large subunit
MSVETLVGQETPVCDAIIQVLEEAGIKMVFGIAGGHTGRIFTALEGHQAAIRTILVREESLAGVMAEVYGRLTRTPGVLMGQGAWVLGNGIIGTLEAFLSSSPMLLLTEFSDTPGFSLHAPYQSGTGEYGAWDARRSFGGITKQVFEATDPVTAVHATQLAVKHALSGQPGPVTVLFGRAGLSGSVSPDSKPVLYNTRHYLPPIAPPADPRRIDAAAKAIAGATKVVLIAGNGVRVSGAYEALARFADATGIPVATTATGKGVFPEDHPLAVGPFGTWGIAAGNFAVAESDVVIVAGSKLGASDTAREHPGLLNASRQTFIQIDVEPRNASWTFPAVHVLIGDAGIVLDQLREALGTDRARLEHGTRRVAELRSRYGYFDEPEYQSDATPILPQRVIGELRRHLPADAIITCDAGENRILTNHFYQTRAAGGILQAAGAGPMGYAIPAALAAKLIYPDRPVVAVCGDGGFAMTMNGLMTAREHGIPIVVLVFNNRSLGAVAHDTGPYATHFGDFDHGAIARGMGCEGVRITNPKGLGDAIRTALAANNSTVIDVVTSADVSFRAAISPPLDK